MGPNDSRGGIFALGNMCFHKSGSDRDLWVPLKFCHQGGARGPLLPTRLMPMAGLMSSCSVFLWALYNPLFPAIRAMECPLWGQILVCILPSRLLTVYNISFKLRSAKNIATCYPCQSWFVRNLARARMLNASCNKTSCDWVAYRDVLHGT